MSYSLTGIFKGVNEASECLYSARIVYLYTISGTFVDSCGPSNDQNGFDVDLAATVTGWHKFTYSLSIDNGAHIYPYQVTASDSGLLWLPSRDVRFMGNISHSNGTPISGASIQIKLNATSTILETTTTNSNGNYLTSSHFKPLISYKIYLPAYSQQSVVTPSGVGSRFVSTSFTA